MDAAKMASSEARKPRLWSWALGVCLLLTFGLIVSLLPHFKDSAELVRMRNALLLDHEAADPAWTPDRRPSDFAVDGGEASQYFTDIVRRHSLVAADGDWAVALAIGQHLLTGGRRNSSAIQSDLNRTYRRIAENGEGYCGDYADVFTGLSHAAGLATRAWAFSFDGFGGRGHIFNEVWDRRGSRWIAIDVFNNMYFVGQAGQPLSALETRDALIAGAPIRTVRVRADVRAGFPIEGRALDFYRRGVDQWYMWWGTNVFEYDESVLVRLSGSMGRSVEQLAGVVSGLHPRIRILEASVNEADRQAMHGLRLRLLAIVGLMALFTALLLIRLWAGRRGGWAARPQHAA